MRIQYLLILCTALIAFGPHARAATYDHAEHDTFSSGGEEILKCSICHVAGVRTIVPDRKVCLQCHDDKSFIEQVEFPSLKTHGPMWPFNHRQKAEGKYIQCSNCHEQSYCLDCHKAGFADEQGEFTNNMANVHRSDYHITHPIAARTDPKICASCHENRFCVDCHNTFNRADLAFSSHRRSWSDLSVSAASHKNFSESECQVCHPNSVLPTHQWSNSHAREARKNLMTCQACHPEGDVCLKCHSAISGLRVNPHPKDWGDISGKLERASGRRTCIKCHR